MMMAGGDDGEGAARRRRQRRLRSWLKHERQSVAMALAEYTHHASRCRRPTGTEASTPAETAGSPVGARAAGRGSHGRSRGCPGASPRGAVDGWWRQRQVPPQGHAREEAEGGGSRGEEESREAVQEGARGGEAGSCPSPRKKKKKKKEEKTSSHCFSLGVWVLPSTRAGPRILRIAWFCSGYMFMPRSCRPFWKNSTQLLREGDARAVRT